MNLDELALNIRAVSREEVVQKLADMLLEWKTNVNTAEELRDRIERYIGNTWIENDKDHSKIYDLWAAFRDEAIGGIEGMTMNERLYSFGLLDRFDASPDEKARLIVYRKLHASP